MAAHWQRRENQLFDICCGCGDVAASASNQHFTLRTRDRAAWRTIIDSPALRLRAKRARQKKYPHLSRLLFALL